MRDGASADTEKNVVGKWARSLIIAAVLLLCARAVLTPSTVYGPSMKPSLQEGERILINKAVYEIRAPKRGEVIVFRTTGEREFVKRVIALPGETVMVLNDAVLINGNPLPEPYIMQQIEEAKNRGTVFNPWKNFKVSEQGIIAVTVPERTVFVMGDNRPQSKDSRDSDIGFVPYEHIVGRAEAVIWPLSDIRFIHTK